jgi:hypothetical protein
MPGGVGLETELASKTICRLHNGHDQQQKDDP